MNPLMKAMGGTPFANIQAIMNQIGQLRQLAGGGKELKSYGNAKMLSLMREAINIEAHGSMWHLKHMLWAQSHGLQGHKRLNRYESKCDREHYIKMQNYCIDMFGEVVEPEWDYIVSAPDDIKGYLESYLEWEDGVYSKLAAISNELIVMGFPCEAELVRDGLPRKEVEKVRRMLVEYGLSGWDMPYILIRDRELHNQIKEKEEKS